MKKKFVDFFTALEEAYAIEIDESITDLFFEEELHSELGDVVVIYNEWSGNIIVPIDENKEIEFDTASRMFHIKGFLGEYSEDPIETFNIRFLKLA